MANNPSPQMVSSLMILITVFHALAVLVTSFRLWFRYHIRRLWWDDFWAALALLSDMVCMVTAWTLTAPLDHPYINVEALPTPAQSRSVHIISYWLNVLFYTCAIWFARISIVFSVARIVPPARSVSMTVLAAGGLFVCMWLYVLAAKSVVCSVDKSWYDTFLVLCPMPSWVALSEVLTDALSDSILVFLPVCLLWRVRLPTNERIMVLSVFSASILVSIVSAVHTSYLIPQATYAGGITAELEGAISLIVCNLLVVVTFFYRISRNSRDLTVRAAGKQDPQSSYCLTTVDLDLSGGSRFTRTGLSGNTFTDTDFTATNVSSVVFSHTHNKDATFGSIVEPCRTDLPDLIANVLKSPPLPIATTKR